jgi:hypothetical protein
MTARRAALAAILVLVGLSSVIAESNPLTPQQPPKCDQYPEQPAENKTVTINYVYKLGRTLRQDILDQGWCLKMIEQRIYGSLQLSKGLMMYGTGLLDMFEKMRSDAIALTKYGDYIKSAFTEAFSTCDSGKCVVEEMCKAIPNYGSNANSQDAEWLKISAQLKANCDNEAWRFQDMIMTGNTTSCEFTYVPIAYASCP